MPPRKYELGRRQAAVDRNRTAIVAAARDLLIGGGHMAISVGAVAAQAGVSRLTVYNRFGSKAGLLRAVADAALHRAPPPLALDSGDPRLRLGQLITESCARWAADPALYRQLPQEIGFSNEPPGADGALAERLAASDQLRPGCSLREAEDVIGAITSFPVFDRLHKDGRRSPSAVAEILLRMAAAILS